MSRGGDMGIGVEGEACGEVTEHSADRFIVCAIQECNGCKGVTETVELYFGIPKPATRGLTLMKSMFCG